MSLEATDRAARLIHYAIVRPIFSEEKELCAYDTALSANMEQFQQFSGRPIALTHNRVGDAELKMCEDRRLKSSEAR